MTSVEVEKNEIPEVLYIAEQELQLVNEMKPYFKKAGNLYIVIAREVNYHNGMNMGDLRAGIIKINNPENPDNFELILPFCKNLLYAEIVGEVVKLTYIENKALKTKEVFLNNEGKLNFEDYAFLLEAEDQYKLKPISR